MGKITSSKDLVVWLLYAKGHHGKQCEPIRGRTRLMKMIFLFQKEIRQKFNLDKDFPDEALPEFTPYDFGPFSAQVYSDLEFLINLGFVAARPVNEPLSEESAAENYHWQTLIDPASSGDSNERKEQEFALTPRGRKFVESGRIGALSDDQKKVLDEFKARCTAASLRSILRYVYTKYPKYATESKIRQEILSEDEF